MTSLYAIAAEYRSTCEALSNLDFDAKTVADTLESISGDLETKAQSVAHVIRAIEADATAVKQWAKDANDRAKALEARAVALRDYLSSNMQACGITTIPGPGVSLSFRESHAVVIDEPALIPAHFMRQAHTPPPAPDKEAIKAAFKLGAEVPGARLETRQNLQIK